MHPASGDEQDESTVKDRFADAANAIWLAGQVVAFDV
jgi:hypothetical protein